ncbi:hypothetical protein YC2023_072218 [Brassica napus]
MFGLHRRNTKEKASRPSASNYFDECVCVQEKPNRWSNEHVNTSKGESDPRRRLLQFDVQQFCDNFVKGVDKALKDISKSQKKSTSTRAPVAEPSFSIKLTVLQPEHPSSLVLSQQVFEEEPLDIPHQCPCLDTWISLDEVPEPIFDVEDKPDPVFDEEATSIISTFMESHLCFDSGTTIVPSSPAPLLPDLQEHCEKSELPDLLSFETDKTWHFLRSFRDNGVVLSSDEILVYNTFFEKCLELLINDSQTELKLVLSFGEALLKPATLMPATEVQSKKDIATVQRSFVLNPILKESQLIKDSLRLGIACKSSRMKKL